MKTEILSSIANLSLVLFQFGSFLELERGPCTWKDHSSANQENKKYAIDWLSSLGETGELKVKRSQYYPKELLYAKPLPGVVGLWYGLSTAVSFDPDLIFVGAGNLPAFNLAEIPKGHFEGLGVDPDRLSKNAIGGANQEVSDLIKVTARKWLISIEDPSVSLDRRFHR